VGLTGESGSWYSKDANGGEARPDRTSVVSCYRWISYKRNSMWSSEYRGWPLPRDDHRPLNTVHIHATEYQSRNSSSKKL
jgi:hypothetical protein